MLVYFILLFTLLFCFTSMPGTVNSFCVEKVRLKNNKVAICRQKLYVILMSISIFIVMGFRDFSVGVDTNQYIYLLKENIYKNWTFEGIEESEWLFKIFNNVMSDIVSARLYLIFLSLIFVLTIIKFGLYETHNIYLFLIFYITIGTFTINMSALRQSIAMSITLASYCYLKKSKNIKFFVAVLIASFFHTSALIFLIAFIMKLLSKIIRKTDIILFTFLPPILFCLPVMAVVIKKVVYIMNLKRYFSVFGQQGINYKCFIFYYGLFLITTVFSLVNKKKLNEDNIIMHGMSLMCCLCYAIAPQIYLFDRLAYYFLPFLITYYVNSLVEINNIQTKKILICIFVFISMIWFFISSYNGTFLIDKYKFAI